MSLLASYLHHAIAVFPSLFRGAGITIEVITFSIFFGLMLGTIAAFGKLSKKSVFKIPSTTYINFIRGTRFSCKSLFFIMESLALSMGLPEKFFGSILL